MNNYREQGGRLRLDYARSWSIGWLSVLMGCGGPDDGPAGDGGSAASSTGPNAASGTDAATSRDDGSAGTGAGTSIGSSADGESSATDTGTIDHPAELVVAFPDASVLRVWEEPDALAADSPADHVIDVPGPPRGLARHLDRLLVRTEGETGVAILDDIWDLADTTVSADAIPTSATGDASNCWFDVCVFAADSTGNLWLGSFESARVLFDGAAAGSAFSGTATFVHPWSQFGSSVYDEASDRLFALQVSGAGIIVWEGASTRTEDAEVHDVTLWAPAAGYNGQYLTVGDDRLMLAGNMALDEGPWEWGAGMVVFPGVGTASDDAPFVFVGPPILSHVTTPIRERHGALFVGSANVDSVLVFLDPAAITARTLPDIVIGDIDDPRQLEVDNDGVLYVRNGDDQVLVYADALDDPKLLTSLSTPGAYTMMVVE